MAEARVAVLISGRGSNMAALIYAALDPASPYRIVLVGSDRPDAPGLTLAAGEGVAVAPLPKLTTATKAEWYAALEAALADHAVDYVALAGFMRILPTALVERWAGRIVNIHPSLLPRYKGLDTHAQAIAAGDSHGGCSVHVVTAELDDGPVIAQAPVAILPGDTAESLSERVLIAEHQLYPRALAAYIMRERDPQWLVGKVRERAMAEPEAEETLSHGMACFGIIGGKKFAYVSIDHHGDGKTALLVKISGAEEQAMLVERDDERFYRPSYFGDGWIAIRLDLGDNDWDDVATWISRSWRAVAPAKLTRLMRAAEEF